MIESHQDKLPKSIPSRFKTPVIASVFLLSIELIMSILLYFNLKDLNYFSLISNNSDILTVTSIFLPIIIERISRVMKKWEEDSSNIDRRGGLSIRNGIIFVSYVNIGISVLLNRLNFNKFCDVFFWGMFICYLGVFIVFVLDKDLLELEET